MANLKEEKKIDQAEGLKQLFEDIESEQVKQIQEHEDEQLKIDVLNLPQRKEVHNQKQFFLRININRPFLRFLFVVILIITIIYFLLYKSDHMLF